MAGSVRPTRHIQNQMESPSSTDNTSFELECRICLRIMESGCPLTKKLYLDLSDEFNVLTLQELLAQICLVAVDTEEENRLPATLCESCRNALISAYQLRITAQKSDITLKERLVKPDVVYMDVEQEIPGEYLTELLENSESKEETFDPDNCIEFDPDDSEPIVQALGESRIEGSDNSDPTVCSICNKNFKRPSGLKKHMRNYHFDRRHVQNCIDCPICNKKLRNPAALKVHMKECHKTDVKSDSESVEQESAESPSVIIETEESPSEIIEAEEPPSIIIGAEESPSEIIDSERKSDPIVCPICNRTLACSSYFEGHMQKHHPDSQQAKTDHVCKCPICNKSFFGPSRLKRHMEKHRPKADSESVDKEAGRRTSEVTVCSICNKSFRYLSWLKDHMVKVHNSQKDLECSTCKKTFTDNDSLQKHQKVHEMFECKICSNQFADQYWLDIHSLKHESSPQLDRYECQQCGKTTKERVSFETHLGTCPNAALRCAQCGNVYCHFQQLITHVEEEHLDLDSHDCNFCGLNFVTGFHLSDHMLSHKGVRPFQCTICRMVFREEELMENHMKTHNGDTTTTTDFLCSHCGTGFRESKQLHAHMQLHREKSFVKPVERPFTCDVCEKSFRMKGTLVAHRKIHTGERPWACKYCGKTFILASQRERHERVHTGEKPYKCQHCDRAYYQSGQMILHMRTHVGEFIYQCEQCPKAFKYQRELRSHEHEHFGEAKEPQDDIIQDDIHVIIPDMI